MYFMMSRRFNKTKPSDFGLIETMNKGIFYRDSDNSYWEKKQLIDLGWGREVGFFKLPKLNYDNLIELVMHSDIEDDFFGSISILLDEYPREFLALLERQFLQNINQKRLRNITDILSTQLIFNSEYIKNQSPDINIDLDRWKKIVGE